MIPGELVEDQQRGEPPQLVERRAERLDVVQHPPGDDRVERPRLVQLLERDPPVERSLGRLGIDGEDVVAGRGKLARDTALVATAHLQHPRRRRRQLTEDVGGEVHAPSNILPA